MSRSRPRRSIVFTKFGPWIPWTTAPTPDDIRRLCRTRAEEIEGFGVGLFGADDDDEEVALPERAIRGMAQLDEIGAEILGALRVLDDPAQSPTEGELTEMVRNLKALTRIAEAEIHAVLLACVRARRDSLARRKAGSPTIH